MFLAKYGSFLCALCVHFEPYYDGSVHIYATTKELKKKAFKINSHNIKKEIGMQVTFIMGNNLQKEHFSSKNIAFLATYASIINPC